MNARDPHTIRTLLDECELPVKQHNPRPIVPIIDATYFGRGYGILVARDPYKHENLHVMEITSETKAVYQEMRDYLESVSYTIQGVVLDGKRGIPTVFKDVPVQICHFHQWQIVRRKLTLRPQLDAHRELLYIGMHITHYTESELTTLLVAFHKKWASFMNEKTLILGTNRSYYTHRKLRSAFLSLNRNLPNLYTYHKHPELNIPNTTNSLDGFFNRLKELLRVHRGTTRERRFKLIRYILGC